MEFPANGLLTWFFRWSFADNSELDAPISAEDTLGTSEERRKRTNYRSREGGAQDLHLSRGYLHCRHRLPKSTGWYCATLFSHKHKKKKERN